MQTRDQIEAFDQIGPVWSPTGPSSSRILEHHKISRYRGDQNWLVEPLRRSDGVDVTRGLVTFGLPRRFLREIVGDVNIAEACRGHESTACALPILRAGIPSKRRLSFFSSWPEPFFGPRGSTTSPRRS